MRSRVLLTLSAALLTACSESTPDTLPDALAAGWQGESVCEELHSDDEQRVLRCIFPPGVGHERHYHAPHIGTIIRGGRMQIRDADGTRVVETTTGGRWTSDGIEWHEVLNVGTTITEYLIVEPRCE